MAKHNLSKPEVVAAVVGIGAIVPGGIYPYEGKLAEALPDLNLWENWKKGHSAITEIPNKDPYFDVSQMNSKLAGTTPWFNPELFGVWEKLQPGKPKVRNPNAVMLRESRTSDFAVAAARMAIEDTGFRFDIYPESRIGISMGTGMGAIKEFFAAHDAFLDEKPKYHTMVIPVAMPNAAADKVAIAYGFKGPCITTTTACAASIDSVTRALEQIRLGKADIMLAGGVDDLVFLDIFFYFDAIGAMSRDDAPQPRPFNEKRSGTILGDGSVMFVLMNYDLAKQVKQKDFKIYALIVGGDSHNDAYNIAAPDETGVGAYLSMNGALHDAGLTPEKVNYISAHATGTKKNDVSEAKAIRNLFGAHTDEIYVGARKANAGHLLGAAGALNILDAVLAMYYEEIAPSINTINQDSACEIKIATEALSQSIGVAVANAAGLGGQCGSVAIETRAHYESR